MGELKKCPFCNGHPELWAAGVRPWWAQCRECGARGPDADSRSDAVIAWNTHADDDMNERAQNNLKAVLYDLEQEKIALLAETVALRAENAEYKDALERGELVRTEVPERSYYEQVGRKVSFLHPTSKEWISGVIDNGYRTNDGIIHVQLDTGERVWCSCKRHGEFIRDREEAEAALEKESL